MTNPFYTRTFDVLPGNRVGSQMTEDQFDLVEQGFDAVAASLDIGQASGTSVTSLVVGTGSKSLTTQAGRTFFPGQSIVIAYTVTPTIQMRGTVTSYNSTSGALVAEITATEGAGTYAAWTVSLNASNGASLGGNSFSGPQNEAKGADIVCAATIDLSVATGNLVHVTGSTGPVTAITIPSGAERTVVFDSTPTLTHSATLILPGAVNLAIGAGDMAIFRGDGTGITRLVSLTRAVVDHCVVVHTGNGHGSTNDKIRRYTTTQTNTGTAITYADSAANGASFTINQPGFYECYMQDSASAGNPLYGISVNSAQLTTDISSITAASRFGLARAATTNFGTPLTRVLRLVIGDVVRPHTDGGPDDTTVTGSLFSIRKVGP
ncbi:MAG: hypothetical protein LCH79_15185 [Proteobacteria bacterium]|nr:hypothetical protein [Pseudomonadota bacterium]